MECFLATPSVRAKSSSFSGQSIRCPATIRRGLSSRVKAVVDPGHVASTFADQAVRVHDALVANTILLADAAASVPAAAGAPAAAADVTDAATEPGLWGSFVKLIEASIQGIHGGLDGLGVPYSYGFAIIGFTLAIKVATLPLNVKQMESTMRMQEMQPKVKQIQTEYRDNPQVMNQMLANLYKEENVNPLAGCLPILAQTPIWIALYRALLNLSEENLLNEPFFWVPSLQGPVAQGGSLGDWLFPLVDGKPPVGWHDAICYLILPIVLVVTQSYSQKVLTPPSDDKQTQQANQILKFLPYMLGWFSLSVPAGLTVYWVTNNVLSTAQTVVLRQRLATADGSTGTTNASSATIDTSARPVQQQKLADADGFSSNTSSKGSKKKSTKKRRK